MKSPEQMGDRPKKTEEESKKEGRKLSLIDTLERLSEIDEPSWMYNGPGGNIFEEQSVVLEEARVEIGEFLIEDARNEKGDKRKESLERLSKVFNLTSLTPKDIGTTNKELQKLWRETERPKKKRKRWFN